MWICMEIACNYYSCGLFAFLASNTTPITRENTRMLTLLIDFAGPRGVTFALVTLGNARLPVNFSWTKLCALLKVASSSISWKSHCRAKECRQHFDNTYRSPTR